MEKCPYSLDDGVPQDAYYVPVQCPKCGARRRLRSLKSGLVFPSHESLNASPKNCDHYELIDGVWKLIPEKTIWDRREEYKQRKKELQEVMPDIWQNFYRT